MKKMLLIDGSSLLASHYYGTLPEIIKKEKDELKKKLLYDKLPKVDGKYVNALRSMLQALKNLFNEQSYEYCAVCFDDSRVTFRNEIYPDYKATRKETPQPLTEQKKIMKGILKELQISTFSSSTYEADDLIASLCETFKENKNLQIHILTKDTDFLQLIDVNVEVLMIQVSTKKMEELIAKYPGQECLLSQKAFAFDYKHHYLEYGYYPTQVVEIKGLAGDTSDNIPGIKGISVKTATSLLNEHHDIEELFLSLSVNDREIIESLWKKNGIKRSPYNLLTKNLKDTSKIALMSKDLAIMKRDISVHLFLEDFEISFNFDKVNKLIQKMYET